ncbi:leucine-rich repeat domain-containing protein [Breznakiellaceae bacterium SP9]
MKVNKAIIILLFAGFLLPVSAQTYYSSDGGQGIRLGVVLPVGQGFVGNDEWVLSYIQGVLTDNFTKFSGMTIIDKQNIDSILDEQIKSLSGNYSEQDYIKIGNLTNSQYILGGTIVKLPSNQFSVQLAISNIETGERKASFRKDCTAIQLQQTTLLNEASVDLLVQMGVALTDAGKQALSTGETINVLSQTALAKGITAQRNGTMVEAMTYFFEAQSYDPSSVEVAARINIPVASVSSGNIGIDARNEIQRQRAVIAAGNTWKDILTGCENFYRDHPPFEFIYSTDVQPVNGSIDQATETMSLKITAYLLRTNGYNQVQNLLTKLNATGYKKDWGLDNWPQTSVSSGVNSFYNRQFSISTELLNDTGKVIGRQMFVLKSSISEQKSSVQDIVFSRVNVNDITDTFTIRIVSINGTNIEQVSKSGFMHIITSAEYNKRLQDERLEAQRKADYIAMFEFSTKDNSRYSSTPDYTTIKNYRGSPIKKDNSYYSSNTTYERKEKDIIIPSVVNNQTVTTIGDGAFVYFDSNFQPSNIYQRNSSNSNNSVKLTSVVIPDSITSIGKEAFTNNQLTSVSIGKGVTSIGDSAFAKNNLKYVVIPDSITVITKSLFEDNQLISVAIPKAVTSIGDMAFSNNQLTSVTIPNSVVEIRGGAFRNNQLTSVTIPNSVTSIGNGVFQSNQLTSITIPNNITSIGGSTFAYNRLTSVTIPDSVTSIGDSAFYYNELKNIVIPKNVKSIAGKAFSHNQLSTITLPNSVETIDYNAFSFNELTVLTIPKSVKTIGSGAFANNNLTSVIIPDSVTSIGSGAFANNQLTSITIPANVTLTAFRHEAMYDQGYYGRDFIGYIHSLDSFDNDFANYYNNTGKRAGAYYSNGKRWFLKQ